MKKFGVPVVVAINRFESDTDAELNFVENYCKDNGADFSLAEVFAKGAEADLSLQRKFVKQQKSHLILSLSMRTVLQSQKSLKQSQKISMVHQV